MSRRFEGLDGLRGIAALIVVVCHSALIFQAWTGGADLSERGQSAPWATVVQRSPLFVFFAGGEAVFVFFILSGFVLLLPFLGSARPRWITYYPKRLLRLYLPILGAVLLAALAASLVPRIASDDQTWWVNTHDEPLSPFGLIREAFVLLGTGNYNSVLWSLKWELIFSMLLPLYVLMATSFQRWWMLGIGSMIMLSTTGLVVDNNYLEYLPMFGIGAFLAVGKDRILDFGHRKPMGGIAMLGAALSLSAIWAFPGFLFSRPLLLMACTALVVAFMVWGPAIRLAERPVIYWLGSRSFSLYLLHEPLVVSSSLIFPGAPWLAVVVAWPVVFLCTELFFRLFEDPSRRFANLTGRVVGSSLGSSRQPEGVKLP